MATQHRTSFTVTVIITCCAEFVEVGKGLMEEVESTSPVGSGTAGLLLINGTPSFPGTVTDVISEGDGPGDKAEPSLGPSGHG